MRQGVIYEKGGFQTIPGVIPTSTEAQANAIRTDSISGRWERTAHPVVADETPTLAIGLVVSPNTRSSIAERRCSSHCKWVQPQVAYLGLPSISTGWFPRHVAEGAGDPP
jgi:hypothetical protein